MLDFLNSIINELRSGAALKHMGTGIQQFSIWSGHKEIVVSKSIFSQ